ncbi:MAG TPA: hypothetical protein VFC82_10780 [Actinomycetaceae bacterium]|nr:hypothetical protein [Actinomycetaceae bacterium]
MANPNQKKLTPMKLLKWAIVILGVLAAIACLVLLVNLAFDMRQVMGYANANKSTEVENPMPLFYWSVGAAALAGLLLGIGFAMPRRTAKAIKKEALSEAGVSGDSSGRTAASPAREAASPAREAASPASASALSPAQAAQAGPAAPAAGKDEHFEIDYDAYTDNDEPRRS